MAKFGPAIFQFFANSTGRVEGGKKTNYFPFTERELREIEFDPGGAQIVENFKNNLFRVVMLRARNNLIAQIEHDRDRQTGKKDFEPIVVNLEITLTETTIHPPKDIDQDEYVIQQSIKGDGQDFVEVNGSPIAIINIDNDLLSCGSDVAKIEATLGNDLKEYKMPL